MSMSMRAATIAFAAALTLIAGLLPIAVAGQAQPFVPVFVAIPQIFPDVDARLILVREPGRDIVVLDPKDASAEALSAGLRLLARLDRPRPGPGRGQMIPVTGFVRDGELPADERAALDATLAELRSKPIAQIGSLGAGRWMPFVTP